MSIPRSRIKLRNFILCARKVEIHRPLVDAIPLVPGQPSITNKPKDSLPQALQDIISKVTPVNPNAPHRMLAYRTWLNADTDNSSPAWMVLDNLDLGQNDRDLSDREYTILIDRLELNDYLSSIERCLGIRA